jgi:hypothetical protein
MARDQTPIDSPALDSEALAPLTVLRPNGDPTPLSDQWRTQPIVLALLRHFG